MKCEVPVGEKSNHILKETTAATGFTTNLTGLRKYAAGMIPCRISVCSARRRGLQVTKLQVYIYIIIFFYIAKDTWDI